MMHLGQLVGDVLSNYLCKETNCPKLSATPPPIGLFSLSVAVYSPGGARAYVEEGMQLP